MQHCRPDWEPAGCNNLARLLSGLLGGRVRRALRLRRSLLAWLSAGRQSVARAPHRLLRLLQGPTLAPTSGLVQPVRSVLLLHPAAGVREPGGHLGHAHASHPRQADLLPLRGVGILSMVVEPAFEHPGGLSAGILAPGHRERRALLLQLQVVGQLGGLVSPLGPVGQVRLAAGKLGPRRQRHPSLGRHLEGGLLILRVQCKVLLSGLVEARQLGERVCGRRLLAVGGGRRVLLLLLALRHTVVGWVQVRLLQWLLVCVCMCIWVHLSVWLAVLLGLSVAVRVGRLVVEVARRGRAGGALVAQHQMLAVLRRAARPLALQLHAHLGGAAAGRKVCPLVAAVGEVVDCVEVVVHLVVVLVLRVDCAIEGVCLICLCLRL